MDLETFFTVSEQCSLFLLSVVLGLGIGVFYDVFRTLRIVFPPAAKKNAVFVEDIIFMAASGAAIFLYSAVLCRGQVRFFCVIGTLLGLHRQLQNSSADLRKKAKIPSDIINTKSIFKTE